MVVPIAVRRLSADAQRARTERFAIAPAIPRAPSAATVGADADATDAMAGKGLRDPTRAH